MRDSSGSFPIRIFPSEFTAADPVRFNATDERERTVNQMKYMLQQADVAAAVTGEDISWSVKFLV